MRLHDLVPLRVLNCNTHPIRGKLENPMEKAATIKEKTKLMSVVIDWFKDDENNVIIEEI